MLRDPFNVTASPAAIGRIVTATITLVCVLIVYDGWATLRLLDVVLIILGPVIAIFTSHVFSTTLVMQVELGRRPTVPEWFRNARFESRYLLLAVPPLVLLLLLDVATVSLHDSVRAVIWMETLSLAFWTGLAAWLVGMRGRPLVLAVLAGLVVGGVVLALQVMLQPGRAVDGGGDRSDCNVHLRRRSDMRIMDVRDTARASRLARCSCVEVRNIAQETPTVRGA